jgi:type-F conjugative transfer system pilin assembly protein TrbC
MMFLSLVFTTQTFAESAHVEAKLESADFEDLKDLELKIRNIPIGQGQGCRDCKSEIQNLRPVPSSDNGILVFVSFSLPKTSLVELSRQAEKQGAILVLRGLYRGSFAKTRDKILSISKDGLNLSIDPELFRKYKILRVPTFILLRDGREVRRLSGNVTLDYAVTRLEAE